MNWGVGQTISEAVGAAEEAQKQDGKVIVCLCGTFAVPADATACPSCGQEVKNA